jgi:hypothetical protein
LIDDWSTETVRRGGSINVKSFTRDCCLLHLENKIQIS